MTKRDAPMIFRPTELVHTLPSICAEFNAGEKTIKRWMSLGAPIARREDGVYTTEKAALWAWLEARSRAA